MRHAVQSGENYNVVILRFRCDRASTSSIETVISLATAEFEELVSEALDTIPVELTSMIENCVIVVEDYPPPDQPRISWVCTRASR